MAINTPNTDTRIRPGNELMPIESDLYSIAATGGTAQRLTDIDGDEGSPPQEPFAK